YYGGSGGLEMMERVEPVRAELMSHLRSRFEVHRAFDFDMQIVDKLAREKGKFDALLTHFPYVDLGRSYSYRGAIANMMELKERLPNLPVVIYTGAAPQEKALSIFDPSNVIFKSRNVSYDAGLILNAFSRLLAKN
ncbi:MAG: hypothetical protein WCK29_04110, partial [archaeon]